MVLDVWQQKYYDVCMDLLPVCGRTDVHLSWHSMGLHPAGCVDSVPKQTIPRHLPPYHSSHHRPSMEANTNLNTCSIHIHSNNCRSDWALYLKWSLIGRLHDLACFLHHAKGHVGHSLSMLSGCVQKSSSYHVCIPYSLHLLEHSLDLSSHRVLSAS